MTGRLKVWDAVAGAWVYVASGGGGGGALVLLEQHTASSSATLDFTTCISATYDDYQIEIVNIIPATNAVALNFRCSTNGGSTYDAGTNYDDTVVYASGSTVAVIGASGTGKTAGVVFDSVSNGTSYGVSASLHLADPLNTTQYKIFYGQGYAEYSGGGHFWLPMIGCVYKSAAAVNALRFLMSSGNIASGTIRVYGIAK